MTPRDMTFPPSHATAPPVLAPRGGRYYVGSKRKQDHLVSMGTHLPFICLHCSLLWHIFVIMGASHGKAGSENSRIDSDA